MMSGTKDFLSFGLFVAYKTFIIINKPGSTKKVVEMWLKLKEYVHSEVETTQKLHMNQV
jgi:hypothetical protein